MKSIPQIFTEVFPIKTEALPKLFAYRLDARDGNLPIIGGKLSYRLRKAFKGHWVWTNHRIVTDAPQSQAETMKLVKKLWQEQPDVFKDLREINPDPDWRLTPKAQANFVVRGLLADVDAKIRRVLARKAQNLGNTRVERVYKTRGWVVQGQPAMSISISSHMAHKQDLKAYAASRISTPEDLIGLKVGDKSSTLKGEITEITGRVSEHRKRLLALTKRKKMQDIIGKASDDELVVRVVVKRPPGYEYVISALRIMVQMEDLHRFNINPRQASKVLRIAPGPRSQLVKEVSELVKKANFVMDAYSSTAYPSQFITGEDVGFDPYLRFGKNQIRQYEKNILWSSLHKYGMYKRAEEFQNNAPLRIGIINALDSVSLKSFLSDLRKQLRSLNFGVRFVGKEDIQKSSRADLEKATDNLQKENPHILLAFFPDEYNRDDKKWGAYHHLKSLTVGREIPSQVVQKSTLTNQYAMANIVLGVLSKTGNIPFILKEPLEYAELVVGIDIARERKKHLAGSINAIAIARIYFNNGKFLRYVIHDAPIEGEIVPANVLQSLFPIREFEGKRVLIHRDGPFRGEEKQILKDWAQKIGATFHFVEIIKAKVPRLYAMQKGKIKQPPKGSVFKLSEKEAFLVSSLPAYKDCTPNPLRIRTEPPLTIEQAIHSVLSLTLLHHGSLRPPKLPITIHYSDGISRLTLKGIKPKNLEGNIPFWL